MKHTVSEIRLKNGAKGLLIDVPGATVMSFQFQFRAGSRFTKSPDIYETAHIMEHMAFGANAHFKSEQEYEEEFTRNGAYHNAFTSDFSMVYVGDCADFEWERILGLKQVAIGSPRFNEESLESEKGNVRSELTSYLNNHNRLLWPRMQQDLGEGNLTYPQRLKIINDISLADIKEHYKRTHTSDNLRFVIAGKLHGRKKRITEMLEGWGLGRGERLAIPEDKLVRPKKPVLIRRKESPNLTFGWSMNIPRRLSDKEVDAMACADHILTGTLYSRIYGAARKKGLVYHIYSDTSAAEYTSAWDFGAQVNLDTAEALVDIIVREIKALLNGELTEKEVATAKQYALGRHQMGAQTVAQINNWYAGRYFFDDTVDNYEARPKAINAISKESIIKVAQEFIREGYWSFGGVGCADMELLQKLREKLAPLFEEKG